MAISAMTKNKEKKKTVEISANESSNQITKKEDFWFVHEEYKHLLQDR